MLLNSDVKSACMRTVMSDVHYGHDNYYSTKSQLFNLISSNYTQMEAHTPVIIRILFTKLTKLIFIIID